MITRHHLTIAVAAAITFAACSGSDDAAEDTTVVTEPQVSTSRPVETTAMTPSTSLATTSVETTMTTTTTSTSTSTTSTTIPATTAPPSTEIPEDQVAAEVAAAAVAAREAYLYAVYNVDAPDWQERLEATSTGASLELGMNLVQTIIGSGWRGRPNPDVPDTYEVERVELVDDTTAVLTTCTVGAGVIYAPGAAEDGGDIVVNDEINASRSRITMKLVDGTWKLSEGSGVDEWPESTSCPDE